MKLGEKAEEGETQFVTVSDLHLGSVRRVESEDLQPADAVGSEEFPQHGDWLETSQGGNVTTYVECPAGLAAAIVRAVEERGAESAEGYWFQVVEKEQTEDRDNAPWTFEVELATADVETREEAADHFGLTDE